MHASEEQPEGHATTDDWRIRRAGADLDRLGETESIFALGNGWLGWRGTLDEGAPCGMPGSYLNGFHERRVLSYPEDGYAFPQLSDTVVPVPNAITSTRPVLGSSATAATQLSPSASSAAFCASERIVSRRLLPVTVAPLSRSSVRRRTVFRCAFDAVR